MQAQDSSHPTGVADNSERGNKTVSRARDRKANAAIQLRIAGASWEEVAETLGFPTGRLALVAVEKALEKELKTEESQKHMRQMAGQRLDRLMRAVWPKAINPDHPEQLQAVDRARQIIGQHTKLYGLDAPTEYVVTSPSQAELEKWVSEVISVQSPALQEDDIFDAEVLEDGPDPEEEQRALPSF
jgi:anti-sigma factor RsiW